MTSVDVVVLGGLTITVQAHLGIWYVTKIAGRTLKPTEKRDWLYSRVERAGETQMVMDAWLAEQE